MPIASLGPSLECCGSRTVPAPRRTDQGSPRDQTECQVNLKLGLTASACGLTHRLAASDAGTP